MSVAYVTLKIYPTQITLDEQINSLCIHTIVSPQLSHN